MGVLIRKSIFISLGILLFIAALATGAIYYFSRDLPSLEELEKFEPDVVSTVYAANGEILTEFGIKNRTLVPLDSIPNYIKDAILATEDRHFYEHWGMDMRRFAKAIWMNLTKGFGSQGASTLTQQLARTLHLNRQETLKRKIQELIVAIQIERSYSKTEILEMYLNSVFWGHGCYGIQAATDYYFSKTVPELTLDESAMLIGILPSPTPWSPRFYHDRAIRRRNLVLRNMIRNGKITQQEFVDALSQETPVHHIENKSLAPYFTEYVRMEVSAFCRKNNIDYYRDGLKIFTTLDLQMQEIAQAAVREQLAEQQEILNKNLLKDPKLLLKIYRDYYPYQRIPLRFFSNYNIIAIRPNEKFYASSDYSHSSTAGSRDASASLKSSSASGTSGSAVNLLPDDMRQPLEKSLVFQPFIYDTLYRDTSIYRYFLQDSLSRDSITFDRHTWYSIIVDSTSLQADSLLAALPLKPKTVQASIFTMDPHKGAILVMVGGRDFEESKFNRAVQARRQPGSTFKPFVYTAVIDNGYSPATQLLNQPPAIPQQDGSLWIPSNFDRSTGGLMTLREGLKHSINLISANAITQLTTPEIVADYARKMGITTELPAYPSLSLGSGEVLLSDMVSAYGVFANNGIWNRPYAIEQIQDRNGREIYRSPRETREVLSSETTFLMVDMMKSVIRDGTGLRVHAAYSFRAPSAGKTGTTNDFTDAWFLGFTPLLISGIWVGVDDARISLGAQQTGSRAALPIWAAFMRETYRAKKYPALDFEKPATVRKFAICSVTKKIPNSFCPIEYEYFNVRHAPKEECDIHGFEVKEGSSGIDF